MRNCQPVKEPVIQHIKPSVSDVVRELLNIAQVSIGLAPQISISAGVNLFPGIGLITNSPQIAGSGSVGTNMGVKPGDVISLMVEIGSAEIDQTIVRQSVNNGVKEAGDLLVSEHIQSSVKNGLSDFVPSMSAEQVQQLNTLGNWGVKGTTKSGIKVSVRGFL